MRGAIIHAPGDVRIEDRPDPVITAPTDAIIEVSATCVCGSDLWRFRGINEVPRPTPIGHESCGVVVEVGADVTRVKPGDFVVASFYSCDGTCPHCRAGFTSVCQNLDWMDGCQSTHIRIPQADGTLHPTPGMPSADQLPDLLALSDVMGTGWHAAVMAGVQPGMTVAVVGDGAVGLCGVLAAAELGAVRVIAMSRHESRQRLAREFGATDIVETRGDEGIAEVLELTRGIGADAVLECVGTGEAMTQALACARPGAMVGFVGVPHGIDLNIRTLFDSNVGIRGGMAAVGNYLPDLMTRVLDGRIHPGKVFDATFGLDDILEAYRAMDERRAIKSLVLP
ncbi:zinc-dependent alcohol dehydrogenase family protein [Propionibacteriaceae bacterium G57]|uniref:zinc-dependent alcohol dehydrogenase family protein n=1 Tax=Aestuariimicrobium sp. G57 TaxID=3418485 RepID=UPI003DA6FE24